MKKFLVLCLVLIGLTTTLFAASTKETVSLWNKANKIADNSVSYIPLSRDITYEEFNEAGDTITESEASIENTLTHYGRYISRTIAGDKSAVALADVMYDGSVITPFEDSLKDMSYSYEKDETVDGILCSVYKATVAFDQALLYFNSAYSESGKLIGWDNDDNEMNGDAVITVYINKETGALVKQINEYYLEDTKGYNDLTFKQEISYESMQDGESVIIYPATTVTTGSYRIIKGYSTISDKVNFTITDTASDIVKDNNFSRG